MLINVMEHPNNINNNVEIVQRPQSIGLPPLTVDVNCNGPLCPNLSVTPQSLQLSPGFLEIPSNDIVLLKTIGKGSFGIVYKAKWNGSGGGRTIAVKKVETVTELSAFHNEIRQLSRVAHDNIVQMYGITSTKDAKCLIMEFADGGSLYQFLHCPPYSSYNLSHALSWLLQCAKAIAYLHAIQPVPIIHRDLKPLNMLLTNRKRVLKICDFGTACDLRSIMTDNRGSTAWMAPEVIRGGKYNEKCDVHSWGMILWEVLTRRIPFEELGQPYRILWKIVNNDRPPRIQGCPVPLEKLIQSCWLDEYSARPTMQEVVDTIYPLCKLMNAADESITLLSSSNDSFTESCVSLINEGSSIDHTSRDISEFTNSTNTIDLPLIDEHASLVNEPPLDIGNLAIADSQSSTGNIHLHLPKVTISPNVSASVIVGVENLLPPWGSATSDEINSHSNNSAHMTPKESSDSLLHDTNGDSSPFVLVDVESKDTSPFIFPVPVPVSDDAASIKNVSPSKREVSQTPLLNAFSPLVFKPLQISIPNSGPPERTDVGITTSQVTTSVLYSNAGASLVKPSLCISPSHRMGQMDNSQISNGKNLSYLLPAVTYSSPDQPVPSLTLTSPPLTSVATSLTLVPPIRSIPKDSSMPQNDNLRGVTLRQNLTANDPEAALRRRSAEVPFHSTCQKGVIPGHGHRRSSSYESKELIGFEPLANEVLRESSLEDRYSSNPALSYPFKNLKETFSNDYINQDEGRLKEDPLSPRNPPPPQNTPGASGFASGQSRNCVTSHPQSVLQRGPPYNLPVNSSGGSGATPFSQYPTRGGLHTPITAATTRGSTIHLPLNIRGAGSPSGRAPNVIPYRKENVGAPPSGVVDDSEEFGALWEFLDDDLKPAMPMPMNHHSQQIFDDHKSLAHQLLVVQEEIVFLDQEKNKLRMRLKEQDTEQVACKKRYNDKLIDLSSKNETLHLNHSRLAHQLEEIRSRNCHRGSQSWSPNQTTPPQTRTTHSPHQSPHQHHPSHPRNTMETGHWSPLHPSQQSPHYPQLHHSPMQPHYYNDHSVNSPHPKR